MTNERYLLEMKNIKKSFPGVVALDGVSINLKHGELLALMGENGAGKSTLMKCLFGVYTPNDGEIYLDGERVKFNSPKEAMTCGVSMVHQELNQALKLTVSENIWLGRFPTLPLPLFINRAHMKKKSAEVLNRLHIDIDPDTKMEKLSVSERQMVEIAKALSYGAKVIVFDEPTSSLSDNEAERLFKVIDELKTGGCGMIYISHKMAEILRISDRVSVMRDGKLVATKPKEEMTVERIISLMVGRELTERYPKRSYKELDVMLSVKGLSSKYTHLKDASFTLGRGEILGVAGLDGSGRTELLEALFGLSEISGGVITLNGSEVKNTTPARAIKNGFALLTEERRKDGIFSNLNIRENTTVSSLKDYEILSILLNDKKMKESTQDKIHSLRVKTPSQEAKIRDLSGGNQQKVILARWLLTNPKVLLLDEPTRGIDVGAKYEIYTLINKLADEGVGVIMVSSEMSELIGMSNRIIVMSGGRIAGEVNKENMTQEKILALATKYV